MDKKIEKIIEKFKGLGIKPASEATTYSVYPTPFSTVTNLIGGIPKGRFTTIAGPEHTGKGAFCAQLIAYLQSIDPNFIALWTDAENAFDEDWAKRLGVDLDRLLVQKYTSEVNTMERLLDNSLNLIKEVNINLWVVDSIGALVPKNDIYETHGKTLVDKSLESTNMLNLQRKLGEFYRKANIIISPRPQDNYEGCAVLMIGQVYTVPDAHVSLEAVKGGNAVKHWAHLRLLFRRGPRSDWPEPVKIMSPDGKIRKVYPGWSGRIKVDKTRVNANEGKEILLPFVHGKGFDSKAATINSALGLDIIKKSAAMYTSPHLPDGKMRGIDNVIQYFLGNDEAYQKLNEEVLNAVFNNDMTTVVELEASNEEE